MLAAQTLNSTPAATQEVVATQEVSQFKLCFSDKKGVYHIVESEDDCGKGEEPHQWTLSDERLRLEQQEMLRYLLKRTGILPGYEEAKKVFVTNGTFSANLAPVGGGGSAVEVADAICQVAAESAGLANPENYMAWLSEYTFLGPDDPNGSFTKSPTGYELVDGTPVAFSWVDLTDGSLMSKINVDEYGNEVTEGPYLAWTGTTEAGHFLSPTCLNWSTDSADESGAVGDIRYTLYPWTRFIEFPCSTSLRLYCFEQ
jgi:hypothetical protein